jgi:hypothetical protein
VDRGLGVGIDVRNLELKDIFEMTDDVYGVYRVAERYLNEVLVTHPITGDAMPLNGYESLSENETRKVCRALFRVEIFYTLFRKRDGLSGDGEWIHEREHLAQTFIASFKAWEREEISRIQEWILRDYRSILQACRPEFELLEIMGILKHNCKHPLFCKCFYCNHLRAS